MSKNWKTFMKIGIQQSIKIMLTYRIAYAILYT